MYSILFLLITVGVYLFFIASDKVKPNYKNAYLLGKIKSKLGAKILGVLLIAICWAFAIYFHGLVSGNFAMGAYIMTSLSLVVLFAPYRIQYWHIATAFVGLLFLETVIF